MNKLTKALLSGVALCALGGTPVVAQQKNSGFHVTALHAGRMLHKTALRPHGITHQTYTVSVYSFVPADTYRKTVYLTDTIYKFYSSNSD